MGHNLPSLFLMKKKGDAYGDFDGRMYPFTYCSRMNSSSALSSAGVIGYTLHGISSGASGLRSMVWSQGLDGGNLCDASSLNNLLKQSYTAGSLVFFLPSPA